MNTTTFQRTALAFTLLMGCAAWADNLAARDQEFLEQAAQNGHAEASASRLALNKARHPQVRAFAQRMVDEHARMDEALRTLATSKNYTPPKEHTMLQKGKEMIIGGLGDDSFDRRYINQMGVQAHLENVRLFEDASRDAQDPEVKAFAARHLPALRDHLKTAREIQLAVEPAPAGQKKR